jgi:hypothetical protein
MDNATINKLTHFINTEGAKLIISDLLVRHYIRNVWFKEPIDSFAGLPMLELFGEDE